MAEEEKTRMEEFLEALEEHPSTQPTEAEAKFEYAPGVSDYGIYMRSLLRHQNSMLREKPQEARKPAQQIAGFKRLPLEKIRDEPLPTGARAITFRMCTETTLRDLAGEERVIQSCSQVDKVIEANALECMKTLPAELGELKTGPGRPGSTRDKVKATLACTTESLNAPTIVALTGIPEGQVWKALGELRLEGAVEYPSRKNVSVKIGLGAEPPRTVVMPQKGVDPLGLPLNQLTDREREKIKTRFCPSPCIKELWWKGKG